jgi:hypothetical protein
LQSFAVKTFSLLRVEHDLNVPAGLRVSGWSDTEGKDQESDDTGGEGYSRLGYHFVIVVY